MKVFDVSVLHYFCCYLLDAVAAARSANEVEMKELSSLLKVAKDKCEELTKKREMLTKQNIRMKPESVMVLRDHDEIIGQLNQKMSDKAK